ncbi:MAG TPA: hypothetical protein VNI02_21610 [Blastocatellia bacterium]|nr:hypothetical protein [Blastocatellia bacterium]
MVYKTQRIFAALAAAVLALASFGCTSAPGPNSNSNSNANANGNVSSAANSNASAASSPFSRAEPDRYSLKMTISGAGAANNRQATMQPQEIDFARMDANRRWALNVAPLGQIIYLEKPGLKYLVLPSRNQYVELTPEAIGFPIGSVLTPSAMVERLKSQQHENLGVEPINGRTATKYRFAGAAQTGTQVGTVNADSIVYVDQDTGLPLRSDLFFAGANGANARVAIETRDIQLNPDPTLFEVPAGYSKVTAEELKQQIQSFVSFIRAIAPMLQQNAGGAPPAAGGPPPANANANANRP